MKFVYHFLTLLLAVGCQNVEAKGLYYPPNSIENIFYDQPIPCAIVNTGADLRGLKDVWSSIKESAITSWNYLKKVAEFTKVKIGKLVDTIKARAEEIISNFQDRLNEFKQKIYDTIETVYGTGQLVIECIQAEKPNLEAIMNDSLNIMVDCITNEIKNLMIISDARSQITLNNTQYMNDIELKLELCGYDLNDVEECMYRVRKDALRNLADLENNILKLDYDSRTVAEDINGSLVTCSIEKLQEASQVILTEIINVAQCVMETEKNENVSNDPA